MIPVLIICHNNGWLVRHTIEQLSSRVNRFIVLDNRSTTASTIEYLNTIESSVEVWRDQRHMAFPQYSFYTARWYDRLPQFFAVTDPDLEYCADMPSTFLEELAGLTCEFRRKAGLALDISDSEKFLKGNEYFNNLSILGAEAGRWNKIEHVHYVVYKAATDTTFAVYNKDFCASSSFQDHSNAVRVGGVFTCKHSPWYRDFWLRTDPALLIEAYTDNDVSARARTGIARMGIEYARQNGRLK